MSLTENRVHKNKTFVSDSVKPVGAGAGGAKLLHRIQKGVGGSPPYTVQMLGCRQASPIGPV